MSSKKELTPEQFFQLFEDYKEVMKAPRYQTVANYGKLIELPHERPMTLKGFCAYGYSKGYSLSNYLKNTNGNYTEFISLSKRIKTCIHAQLLELGLLNLINANLTCRILDLNEVESPNQNNDIRVTIVTDKTLNEF